MKCDVYGRNFTCNIRLMQLAVQVLHCNARKVDLSSTFGNVACNMSIAAC